jgi:phage-related baseplate assembly protein
MLKLKVSGHERTETKKPRKAGLFERPQAAYCCGRAIALAGTPRDCFQSATGAPAVFVK